MCRLWLLRCRRHQLRAEGKQLVGVKRMIARSVASTYSEESEGSHAMNNREIAHFTSADITF